MSKKAVTLDTPIAVPFHRGKDGDMTVADYHFAMDEHGEFKKERRPGRPKISFHLKEVSECERKADEIVKNPNLSGHQRAPLVNRMSQFLDAAIKLNNHIRLPSGNVDVSVDSVELRNLWHLYLIRGREFLDEVGRKTKICFGLKQGITGLNVQKFGKLENILRQEMRKRDDLQELMDYIETCRQALTEFIELRNREKTHNDTLIMPPSVSPLGIPGGGKVVNRNNNKEYVFVHYFESSFKHIIGFAKTILG